MGLQDSRLPIQFALFEEESRYMPYERLNLATLKNLSFEEPDMETFMCLKLAYEALEHGKEIPTVLNAANEMAVAMFLKEKIAYLDISNIISSTMEYYVEQVFDKSAPVTLEKILQTETWTYNYIKERWSS